MSNEIVNNEVNKLSIYDKILEKSSLDAAEIKKIAITKAKEVEEEILNEAKAEAEKLNIQNEAKNNDLKKSKITDLDRKYKREVLFKKKELMDKLVDEAIVKLNNLKEKALLDFSVKNIKESNLVGDEVLRVNQNDYNKFLKAFSTKPKAKLVELDLLNKALGKGFTLKLEEVPANIKGGFIVIGKDFDIDLSFEAILELAKDTHEAKVANLLFKEAK